MKCHRVTGRHGDSVRISLHARAREFGQKACVGVCRCDTQFGGQPRFTQFGVNQFGYAGEGMPIGASLSPIAQSLPLGSIPRSLHFW